MRRIRDSNIRQLLRLTQALANPRQGALTHTNKKNEGRSEEVIENTGPHDFMSVKNERFCVRDCRNLRKSRDFFTVSHHIFAYLRPKNTAEPGSCEFAVYPLPDPRAALSADWESCL